MHFAHTQGHGPDEWEPLLDHLKLVAEGNDIFPGTAAFAERLGARDWGCLLGWWHDLGKFAPQFQAYLRQQNGFEAHLENLPGRVDHSTAGALYAARRFKNDNPAVGRILAYCIAGHHAGLPDWNTESDASLYRRLNAKKPETAAALAQASQQVLSLPEPAMPAIRPANSKKECGFQMAFFTRMLFSCLVDADFVATEIFMDQRRSDERQRQRPGLARLNQKLEEFIAVRRKQCELTQVNMIRGEILAQCQNAASLPPGFFSLTVPTGGGKTLSSLSFALRHAVEHNHERVIYSIPFTSIVEQNADVFRDVFQELAETGLVEHHSNLDPEQDTTWNRLSSENWDAPLIITTNVQLLESLFASRTSRCRKLHRIARSVIILDEAQTLPVELLEPCLQALRELVRNYHCTIVLCTATQPAIQANESFKIGIPREQVREIIPDPSQLYNALRRVNVRYVGSLPDNDLVAQFASRQQALCIVNTTRHAAEIFQQLREHGVDFHLSARMCPAHRSRIIDKIRQRLKDKKSCRLVSTQLIEAGVDIDFPVVYRAIAGFDSIAQAAGRCNREGRLNSGEVIVFNAEQPPPLGHFRQTAETAKELIPMYDDILSLEALEQYFRMHYWEKKSQWDKRMVLDCFDMDLKKAPMADFRQAAERFQMIPQATKPVIVPWRRKGEWLVRQLRKSLLPSLEVRRALQRYAVQIHQFHWDRFKANQWIELVHDQYPILIDSTRYHKHLGISLDDNLLLDPDLTVV
ncbi:CRISPR-associated helicase/endonuclease Cas3 [Bremerella cremea]|uniref:CRISPR-associated helicase/endonuclease Cas3 n=1 Tax=Blastopirellula marina TaxID=124 RepID=A0A2S8FDH0_9BACT|nr:MULTISPECIES: CRISPR-associated helicase/endonuclease Cas3 [Pirellulaceae]PQO30221.1 CRISPR-associated helicase/endonuclease Cas3 [Blastopirellula marina]RCS43572.1 CRISPR-associated helicase/endonuclease Cas3 [Bremerella cremea]